MRDQQTIFITSFHPLIMRNILATPILDYLLEKNVRVVVFAPEKTKFYFEWEFESRGVIVESVSRALSWQDRLFRYLSLAALNTRALAIKRKTELEGSGTWLAPILGRSRVLRATGSPFSSSATGQAPCSPPTSSTPTTCGSSTRRALVGSRRLAWCGRGTISPQRGSFG